MVVPKSRLRANDKYRKKNYRFVQISLTHEQYAELVAAAEAAGEPLATYVKNSIRERMERGY